jgi:hypothetical protein
MVVSGSPSARAGRSESPSCHFGSHSVETLVRSRDAASVYKRQDPPETRAHRRRVTPEPGVSAAFAMSLRAIWSRS